MIDSQDLDQLTRDQLEAEISHAEKRVRGLLAKLQAAERKGGETVRPIAAEIDELAALVEELKVRLLKFIADEIQAHAER